MVEILVNLLLPFYQRWCWCTDIARSVEDPKIVEPMIGGPPCSARLHAPL